MVDIQHVRGIAVGIACCTSLVLGGCFLPKDNEDPDPLEQQEQDIEDFNALQRELDRAATETMGDVAGCLYSAGTRLFWLEHRSLDPSIHSWDSTTDTQVNYDFSPGGGGACEVFVASSQVVAWVEERGMSAIYHVMDASSPNSEIATASFDMPGGIRHWAYAVSDSDLYIVEEGEETTLWRLSPGGEPVAVTTLESAGCAVEIFMGFGVWGGTMVFIESGRIWRLDLPSNTATWLGNEHEISGWVHFGPTGALYVEYMLGPRFFDFDSGLATDLGAALQANDYELSETFSTAHHFGDDGQTLYGDYMIYVGNMGLFAYDLVEDLVVPILLEPRMGEFGNIRVDYIDPVVLDNGMLFVTGLESESGSRGADGPVWRVDLTAILP